MRHFRFARHAWVKATRGRHVGSGWGAGAAAEAAILSGNVKTAFERRIGSLALNGGAMCLHLGSGASLAMGCVVVGGGG